MPDTAPGLRGFARLLLVCALLATGCGRNAAKGSSGSGVPAAFMRDASNPLMLPDAAAATTAAKDAGAPPNKPGGGAGTSMSTGAGGSSSAGTSGSSSGASCLGADLLAALGRDHVMVGASMADETAKAAPFDARYLYLSGGLFDGTAACASCASGCTAAGKSCANSVGCGWWGCWQYDQDPPGAYVRSFVSTAEGDDEIPMFTYYEVLQASGAKEGMGEVTATADAAFMQRYLADFAFVLDQIGSHRALVHIEPDFWGYAEQANPDPHATHAAVSSASAECKGFEDSIAGLGRCMIAMAHKHAPNARVGLHASGWATKIDVLQNRDPNLDVAAEARKLADFLAECGSGDADFVAVDPSDRDAAYYAMQGQSRGWDAQNATLPNFHQALAWAKALAERANKPIVWWQIPVGNSMLANTPQHYQDNRVDYFMTHMDEVAGAHGAALMFGAGDGQQTTPETDGGHLVSLVKNYAAKRQPLCP